MHRHVQETKGSGCLLAFGLVFFCVGLFSGAMIFQDGGIFFALLFGGIFSLVGGLVVAFSIHQMMGDALFKELYLETPERSTRLGETFSFRLGWIGKRAFRVDSVEVRYYLEERAILRRGTNSTTYSRKLYEQVRRFDPGRDLQSGESFQVEGEFETPADGPSSLSGNNNFLTWKVEVSVDVPNWPDPSATWELTMRPVLAPEALEAESASGPM